jgi:hypothetical protein
MWDLILDGAGGLIGGLLGPLYMTRSRESRRRVERFAQLLVRRPARGLRRLPRAHPMS